MTNAEKIIELENRIDSEKNNISASKLKLPGVILNKANACSVTGYLGLPGPLCNLYASEEATINSQIGFSEKAILAYEQQIKTLKTYPPGDTFGPANISVPAKKPFNWTPVIVVGSLLLLAAIVTGVVVYRKNNAKK